MSGESGFQLAGSAPERYERTVAPIMAPFVSALLDSAGVGPGAAVLDVACGTGFVARAAAARVGASGRVAGVDINAGMLAVAERASRGVVPVIEWHEASAEAVPLPGAAFDAVVCQQGMQFFPDLDRAAREMARLVRPGGRVAATVWAPLGRSPYFAAQADAVESLLGPDAMATFTSAFGCTADRLADAFTAAGLDEVERREVVAEVAVDSFADYVPNHLLALPWGAQLAEASPDGVEAASRLILERLRSYVADDTLTAPFASALVVATHPT